MAFFKRSLAGPGYIILNVIRGINIISLLMVMTASMVMLVKTFVVSQFYFFDGCSHVITFFLSIFLIASEVGVFRKYFMRNWPLLGHEHGFLTLGLLMIIEGVSILGNLNKAATSEQNLGLSFWQIVISSGILTMIMGVANIIANYVFRQKSLHVTARMVRAYGAVAPQKVNDIYPAAAGTSSSTPHLSPSVHSMAMNQQQQQLGGGGLGLGQGGPRPASSIYSHSVRTAHRSFSAPHAAPPSSRDALPSYHPPETVQRANTSGSRFSVRSNRTNGLNISEPVNFNAEQFAKFKNSDDIRRPDLAAHPAMQGGRF